VSLVLDHLCILCLLNRYCTIKLLLQFISILPEPDIVALPLMALIHRNLRHLSPIVYTHNGSFPTEVISPEPLSEAIASVASIVKTISPDPDNLVLKRSTLIVLFQ
jgi:hypothetical protein